MSKTSETILEQTALDWFESLGWQTAFGPDISPDLPAPGSSRQAGGPACERQDYDQVVLSGRLQIALENINPNIPTDATREAVRKITRTESPSLTENNRRFHRMLTDGVDVSYMQDGREVHDKVWLLDLEDLENNDWLAVNQFTVIEDRRNRRPDIVVFVNGLPLGVIELKNPADENATIQHAYNQLQTYKQDIPSLFIYNELLVISDGLEARSGTLTSGWDRFMPWRTIDGTEVTPKGSVELEVLLKGIFDKRRFLDLMLNFIVFEDDGSSVLKKIAAYHQYHAVNKAVDCTISACGIDAEPRQLYAEFPDHDEMNPFGVTDVLEHPYGKDTTHFGGRRIGVIWHTQGSGKSLSMAYFAGKIIRHPAMKNPTIVVITDRNDLDDQLFGTFSRCRDLMRQTPVQAETRENLRELLKVAAGGVVFTTIQKFMPDDRGDQYPELSPRENIVVIADEAHRSQYDFIDGYARHMRDALPKASFIGFTATPIERDDRSTPAVFGDYIDTYDMLRAIEDKATVPIYYEGRLAKIELDDEERPVIDPEFEEITEGEEEPEKQRLRTKWAALEAMVGTEKRIALVAEDIVKHLEQRQEAMKGKALIVCMSRRICVEVYNAIVKLRPGWHGDGDDKGTIKIVMSGAASDRLEWQPHIRNKARRETLATRFKDANDPLSVVIVRDMWLTGFDCPSMHTMYVDKPMRGHGLMQAIARVNRVFKDKPGGLMVDYIGLAYQLKRALADYTEAGGRGKTTIDQEEAVALMREKYDIVVTMYHGFDYLPLLSATPANRLAGIAAAMEHLLQLDDGKNRYLESVTALSKAFALAVPHEEAIRIRDDVGFFQEVRSALAKATVEGRGKTQEEMDTAIQQLVSRAVISDEVVDIFASVGLKKPDISILSEEFLKEVRQLPHKNLAVEVLRKLLDNEIKGQRRKNVVQARSFSEMVEESIRKYQNRSIEAAQVIEELIGLAKEIREAQKRGEELGLSDDEIAFYDALGVNDSAVKILGDDTLKTIAHELVTAVRRNVSVDWTVRENARAHVRVVVRRILRKYGYPPDKQEKATQTVLEQAEVLCKDFVAEDEEV
jgi:type I restriction enzyme R subunit